jgi:hypothetical protein
MEEARFALGGIAAFALGVLLLILLPWHMKWRALAAFALGLLFLWLAGKMVEEKTGV